MSALVFLIRHAAHSELGHRLTGRGGGGLTADGRQQASRLAERLASAGLAALYTSPRQRARETADVLTGSLSLPLHISPQLDEIDFGGWTGASFRDLADDTRWQQWNRQRSRGCPPGGETMAAATDRMLKCIGQLAEQRPGTALGLVTHGDMIRGAIIRYLGLSFDDLFRFEIAPASFSRLRVASTGTRVLSINEEAT